MKSMLLAVSMLISHILTAQFVVTDTDGEHNFSYSGYLKAHGVQDSLSDFRIEFGNDTIYHFHSIMSRVVVQNGRSGLELNEAFAVPQPETDEYDFVVFRKLTTHGKLPKSLSKAELIYNIPVIDTVRVHLRRAREAISNQKTIDEYDLPLVHLTARLIWEMTLVTLSGDNEFYSILTNLTTELPASVAGKAAYAWNDCKYLLREQKVPGFTSDF